MNHGGPKKVAAEIRFWTKIQKTETCWLWTGTILKGGYGKFRDGDGQLIGAHHFLVGRAPDGWAWHHLCGTHHCVNPSHLEMITKSERTRRGKRTGAKRTPAEIRFWAKVDRNPDGCWLWTGYKAKNGYGLFNTGPDGRSMVAHRFSAGEPPEGLVWDHLCRVRHCVRPDHLEAVTQGENVRRGERWGSQFTDAEKRERRRESLRRHRARRNAANPKLCRAGCGQPMLPGKGQRYCKTCQIARHARH